MSIEDEIEEHRRNIRSDSYQMSIGEVLNLYRDHEIRIRPEFQRLFRWPLEKQAKLIESILLDIPLPPVFVSQAEDSVWEVVDGLQRLSTILSFVGELRDESTDEVQAPSVLTRTKYIPSLEGMTYANLPQATKIQFKRSRLDFRILLKESDDSVKYELFDRLNSGGLSTSPQEVRTAILIMNNEPFYQDLDVLRGNDTVVETMALTARQIEEQYDLELLVRFLAIRVSSTEELASFSDMDTFLTDKLMELAKHRRDELSEYISLLKEIFAVASSAGPAAFRKFDSAKNRSVGGFSVSTFEAVTAGLAAHIEDWKMLDTQLQEKELLKRVQELWADSEFIANSGAGVRATSRVPRMPAIGTRIFVLN